MGLRIVPYYAAVLALLFVLLSLNVIRGRREHKVAIGVSGNSALERRVRVHANFAEYAPFALLLIAISELREAPVLVLHALCISLVLGRLAHAWDVSQPREDFRFRVTGMAATFAAIVGAAFTLLLA